MKATDFFSSLFCFAICIFAGQVNPRQGLGKELANPSFAFHSLFPRPSPVVLSNVVQYSFTIHAVFSHYMCSLPLDIYWTYTGHILNIYWTYTELWSRELAWNLLRRG
jgi:hypothetical protein